MTNPVPGYLSVGTRRILATHATDKDKVIVELGSWMGRSSLFLAACATGAKILCIDHFKGSEEHQGLPEVLTLLDAFKENTGHEKRIEAVQDDTLQGMMRVAGRYQADIVFVDAAHDYMSVVQDIFTASRLWPDAKIVGDDWGLSSVRRAVRENAKRLGRSVFVDGNGWAMIPKQNRIKYLPHVMRREYQVLRRVLKHLAQRKPEGQEESA